jgi:hypothetical protein
MTTPTKPTTEVVVAKELKSLDELMLPLVIQLRWKNALDACLREGRDYTEIHFWRDPETDEFVLTYWEIK